MHYSVTDQADRTLVSFQGDLTVEEIGDLEKELRGVVEKARPAIVVRLAEVGYMDSSGAGLLVSLLQRSRESNRKLILADLPPGVAQVFRLSNLDKVFEIVAGDDEAQRLICPQKVFLFDDREEQIYFYQEVVRANRLEFEHGSDLEQALQRLRSGEVDLVLVDALENEEPKYELVRRMKQDEHLAKIPVVALSIYEDEEQPLRRLGVERFVLKPFLVEKFVATLKQLLGRRAEG